jgi:hypothetical protein
MASGRRRRWRLFLPFVLVVTLALLWTAGWFYLAALADGRIEDWRAREAGHGIISRCAPQTIRGFPFRMEVRCREASVELPAMSAAFATADLLVAWQVYQPTLAIAELTAPLSLGEVGKPPQFLADWQLGQASIRFVPAGVERASVVFEAPSVTEAVGAAAPEVFRARHVELHGRPNAGSEPDHPAIDLAIEALAVAAPALHPLLAQPIDAEGSGVLHELPDPTPRPMPVMLRQWQARAGRLEISKMRVQQGDVIAVGAGVLTLTPTGGLNGELQITVVGLEKALQQLGLDRMVSQGELGSAIGALNRFMPGLGDIARQNAPAGIVAGLGALGQRTTLEGKPAVTVPLRFDDGAILLGPLMIGRAPRLF